MNFFELNFSSLKQNFFELCFLVSYSKLCEVCAKFKMQKEKSRKKNFNIGKKTAKRSLVILFALVIYTAPTVDENFIFIMWCCSEMALKGSPSSKVWVAPRECKPLPLWREANS